MLSAICVHLRFIFRLWILEQDAQDFLFCAESTSIDKDLYHWFADCLAGFQIFMCEAPSSLDLELSVVQVAGVEFD